ITRAPFCRDSLVFSAISRQHTTLKNEVASSHSWVWRFCQRRLTAMPSEALAWPLGVNRSSGSRVMLPTSVMLFPLDMVLRSVRVLTRFGPCLLTRRGAGPSPAGDAFGKADHLVADDLVREMQCPVELGHHRRLGLRLHEHVVAVPAVVELVGEPALSPPVDPIRVAPAVADQVGRAVDGRPDRVLLQAGVEDDHDLIGPHALAGPPSGPGGEPGPRRPAVAAPPTAGPARRAAPPRPGRCAPPGRRPHPGLLPRAGPRPRAGPCLPGPFAPPGRGPNPGLLPSVGPLPRAGPCLPGRFAPPGRGPNPTPRRAEASVAVAAQPDVGTRAHPAL